MSEHKASILLEYEALRDAYTILHDCSLNLSIGYPDAVWRIVDHAARYIDKQINDLLREPH